MEELDLTMQELDLVVVFFFFFNGKNPRPGRPLSIVALVQEASHILLWFWMNT